MRKTSALLTIALSLGTAPSQKPPKAAESTPLGQAATETLVHAFENSEHWTLQAIALLSLGGDWHPAGASAVIGALEDKDRRLRAFGIEVLRRMERKELARVMTPELVTELVKEQLDDKNQLVRERVLDVLGRVFPEAAAEAGTEPRAWQSWWRKAQEGYAPPQWSPPDAVEQKEGTVVGTLVRRAFDLRDAGLEVAIVIDSTGSMQTVIDSARDAIGDIVALLSGIAPDFKLGLVHYKDLTDFKEGARVLAPLSKNQKSVERELSKLRAMGGGDIPERVEKGIEVALSREMRWSKGSNRLVIVIGDAPPHPETQSALLEMVERAHEDPDSLGSKGPLTGKPREAVNPFVISTIATHQQAKVWFDEIAAAGGGVSVLMPIAESGKDKAVEEVVRHVLVLSFGAKYEPQLRVFADVFFEYRAAGAFGR